MKLLGKILPLDPIKVSSPNFLQKSLRSSCEKLSNNFLNLSEAFPYFFIKAFSTSECVIFKPPRPANKNLRPTVGFLSKTVTQNLFFDKM